MNRRNVLSTISVLAGTALAVWLILTIAIWLIAINVVLLAVLGALLVILAIRLGNQDAFFTMVPQDTARFISVGQSMKRILPNVTGFMLSRALDLDGRQWLIPAKDELERTAAFFRGSLIGTVLLQKLLWKNFGVRFYSFFYPQAHVQPFDIRSMKVIKDRSAVGPDEPLRARAVEAAHVNTGTTVKELRFLVPRPVYLEGIELAGDNAKINLLLLIVFRLVIPALPTYTLRGDFFTPLDAAIEAAVVDFCAAHRVAVYKANHPEEAKRGQFAADSPEQLRDDAEKAQCDEVPLTYSLWLKLTKAGEGSPMQVRFRGLNVSRKYFEDLRKESERPGHDDQKELLAYVTRAFGEPSEIVAAKLRELIPSGVIPHFGFAIESARIVEWEPHEDSRDLANALRQKEVAFHTAEGVRQTAAGERDRILAVKEGEAARYDALLAALKKNGVDANMAAYVAATQIRMEQVAKSNLTTYVEGGASTQPVVSI